MPITNPNLMQKLFSPFEGAEDTIVTKHNLSSAFDTALMTTLIDFDEHNLNGLKNDYFKLTADRAYANGLDMSDFAWTTRIGCFFRSISSTQITDKEIFSAYPIIRQVQDEVIKDAKDETTPTKPALANVSTYMPQGTRITYSTVQAIEHYVNNKRNIVIGELQKSTSVADSLRILNVSGQGFFSPVNLLYKFPEFFLTWAREGCRNLVKNSSSSIVKGMATLGTYIFHGLTKFSRLFTRAPQLATKHPVAFLATTAVAVAVPFALPFVGLSFAATTVNIAILTAATIPAVSVTAGTSESFDKYIRKNAIEARFKMYDDLAKKEEIEVAKALYKISTSNTQTPEQRVAELFTYIQNHLNPINEKIKQKAVELDPNQLLPTLKNAIDERLLSNTLFAESAFKEEKFIYEAVKILRSAGDIQRFLIYVTFYLELDALDKANNSTAIQEMLENAQQPFQSGSLDPKKVAEYGLYQKAVKFKMQFTDNKSDLYQTYANFIAATPQNIAAQAATTNRRSMAFSQLAASDSGSFTTMIEPTQVDAYKTLLSSMETADEAKLKELVAQQGYLASDNGNLDNYSAVYQTISKIRHTLSMDTDADKKLTARAMQQLDALNLAIELESQRNDFKNPQIKALYLSLSSESYSRQTTQRLKQQTDDAATITQGKSPENELYSRYVRQLTSNPSLVAYIDGETNSLNANIKEGNQTVVQQQSREHFINALRLVYQEAVQTKDEDKIAAYTTGFEKLGVSIQPSSAAHSLEQELTNKESDTAALSALLAKHYTDTTEIEVLKKLQGAIDSRMDHYERSQQNDSEIYRVYETAHLAIENKLNPSPPRSSPSLNSSNSDKTSVSYISAAQAAAIASASNNDSSSSNNSIANVTDDVTRKTRSNSLTAGGNKNE